MYQEHNDIYFEFNIIGIGKSVYSNFNGNFTDDTDLPLVVDSYPDYPTWSDWDVNQRDLIFLDKNGNYFCKINLTAGFNEQEILDKIYHLHWNTTAYIDTDIDIIGTDNLFEPGSEHSLSISVINNSFFDSHYTGYNLSSNSQNIQFSLSENLFYVIPEGETAIDYPNFMISEDVTIGEEIIIYAEPSLINGCEECYECQINCIVCPEGGESQFSFIVSTSQLLGDINSDGELNVIDIVVIVNLILNGESYDELGDVNEDGDLNVVDIVQLVNIILN